jgi:starch synthase
MPARDYTAPSHLGRGVRKAGPNPPVSFFGAVQTSFQQVAIRFEPDGYMISGPRLMGRHSAGHGFLRAAVADRRSEPLWAYTPHKSSADIFNRLVREMDPTAETRWVPADRLDLLARLGTLYLPAPGLVEAARLRLRAGPAAFSLCGVTHTTATHLVMDAITGLLTAPVMPWDALVCTSQAVAATVRVLIENQAQYLRWRLAPALSVILPLLPVIPLGVHTADFAFTAAERASARRDLGIGADEVVALFLGRLSFHAKAHPYPMYVGLEQAARQTGKKIALLQCGWFGNAPVEAAFREGAARICPTVRALFTDGKDLRQRRLSWAAADLFISLSDNIQETFGLTPIEAMAAGLPVVVTDWDGYRDTVRDGVDGFRIATRMPAPGFGEELARGYEVGAINYDFYCGFACQMASLDLGSLTKALSALATRPELRRRLGAAGRLRARELFDWAVIYGQYRELWAELAAIRRAAQQDPEFRRRLEAAPRAAANRIDPFVGFAQYPTAPIDAATLVAPVPDASGETYRTLIDDALFSYAKGLLPAPHLAGALLDAVRVEPGTVEQLAARVGLDLGTALRSLSIMAKIGLVELCLSSRDAAGYAAELRRSMEASDG